MAPVTRAARRAGLPTAGDDMESSPPAGSPAGGEEADGAAQPREPPLDLTGDKAALGLLLLLYTLQGVPMGLAATVSLLLQERGASFAAQGVFSFVSWPFSLKVLWAPLVDAAYVPRLGQRRTWLVPVQAAIGLLLLRSAPLSGRLLGDDPGGGGGGGGGRGHHPDVPGLTALFLALYFLCATQDVAVDGWALSLLSRRNVGLASTVNAVGQSLGSLLAFSGFSVLSEAGLVSLPAFLAFWGALFVLSALAVAATPEAPPPARPPGVGEVYGHAARLLARPPVRRLCALLLLCRLGFGATDGLATLQLARAGLSKARLAGVSALLAPLSLALPLLLAGRTGGPRPWALFLAAYPLRLLAGLALACLLLRPPAASPADPSLPALAAAAGLLLALREALSTAQFCAQMGFFARVADPAIGGTAMTLLNTAGNLGAKWPQSLALFAAEALAGRMATCELPGGAGGGGGAAAAAAAAAAHGARCGGGWGWGGEGAEAAAAACAAAGGACVPAGASGGVFLALSAAGAAAGGAWLLLGGASALARLQDVRPSAWLAQPQAA